MFITVAQFFLSLSILVVLHELGHFGAAKWFKTKVEKFYLFFNPGFSLFKKQIGETEYGVGWLPLGGYVKIAGMIDESFDTEQMQSEPKPWEFRSKPAWQRLIIMVGGVFVNFVLGVFLFTIVLAYWGKDYIPNDSLSHGIAVSEIGKELGLQDGDQILSIGDYKMEHFRSGAISKELVINQAQTINVERAGKQLALQVDPAVVTKLTKHENRNIELVAPRFPYVLNEITEGSGAQLAGLEKEDRILAVDGVSADYTHLFLKAMRDRQESASVNVQFSRNGNVMEKVVSLKDGKMGVRPQPLNNYISLKKEKYSIGKAIPAGWNRSIGFLTDQIKAFGQMFSGKIKAKDSLGSFITIGSMFGTSWDWERFWSMTASLSLLLGFINLLPIPALDGGYVMFLLFEVFTGRKIPDRFMEITTFAGFVFLMGLMIYAFGLDISRFI